MARITVETACPPELPPCPIISGTKKASSSSFSSNASRPQRKKASQPVRPATIAPILSSPSGAGGPWCAACAGSDSGLGVLEAAGRRRSAFLTCASLGASAPFARCAATRSSASRGEAAADASAAATAAKSSASMPSFSRKARSAMKCSAGIRSAARRDRGGGSQWEKSGRGSRAVDGGFLRVMPVKREGERGS
eukprot:scaffold177409_cov33-Tisochrysis_lutea.AAC.1